MTLSRSGPIEANTAHDWEEGVGGWWTCERCDSSIWSPDGEPDVSWPCKGSMRRRSQLESTKRLPPINQEKRERSRTDTATGVRHTYGPYWVFASHLPCCVCGHVDGCPADHWTPVGRGGKDPGNCLPICAEHNDRHDMGPDTWAARYDVQVQLMLRDVWDHYKSLHPDEAARLEPHLPDQEAA